jgi:hypothetical protein
LLPRIRSISRASSLFQFFGFLDEIKEISAFFAIRLPESFRDESPTESRHHAPDVCRQMKRNKAFSGEPWNAVCHLMSKMVPAVPY